MRTSTISTILCKLSNTFCLTIAFAFVCLFWATPIQATVYYVKTNGSDSNSGTSWAQAFLTVQKAINTASSGDEIWVKTGTYKPTEYPSGCTGCSTNQDFTFHLKNGVALYGGFAGTETLRTQRLPAINITTLSGDIGVAGVNTDNCYHVVLSVSDNASTVLDGFTITEGYADGSVGSSPTVETKSIGHVAGGGMFNHTSSPTVANCIFFNNSTSNFGAGMYNTSSSPMVTACTFSENSAGNSGGGMNSGNSSHPIVTNCSFINNDAGSGGGMANGSTLQVTNCFFLGNSASSNGGGMSNGGGNSLVTNCLFSGNKAHRGGGMSNSVSNPTVVNCTFSGNNANVSGGGMYNNLAHTVVLKNCVIWNNRNSIVTGDAASAIFNESGTTPPTITYSLIQKQNPSGAGNLNGNTNASNPNRPNFVTPLDPTTAPSTDGDFHIQGTSPIANVGDNASAPATDLFGNTRPYGTTVDMGVHELQSANCPAPNTIWYVDASAASGGTGTSWGCAFQHVQDAITAASSGHEIWVKTGTYLPTEDPFGNASPTDPRDKTFYLKNGVALYGGFDATETMRSERDWAANVTTLSGDIGTASDNMDNCYHVVLSASDGNTTVLDGFTVTNGNANGGNTFIVVEGRSFARNNGGGIYNNSSALSVANCLITDNQASLSRGGGMYSEFSSSLTTNCTFSQNTATYGGGVFSTNSNPSFTGCSFLNNTASISGGGMRNESSTSVTVISSVFSGNTAGSSNGGGFYIGTSSTSAVLTNCLFSGNSAGGVGGGIYNSGTPTATLTNCTITGNQSAGNGGGIYFAASNPTLTNCVSWNNRANGATGTSASGLSLSSSTPTITYSLIQNHNPSGTGNLDGITPAAQSNYPNFVTPLDPATAPSASGDFHLEACSPVVDAGTGTGAPATDLFGNNRPFGEGVDLGVHEVQSAQAAIVANCQNTTVNLDGTGTATLDPLNLDNNSMGGCPPLEFSASQTSFNCSHLGANTVALAVTDANGVNADCEATVTVTDNLPPNALCRDFVKNLNASGMATITPAEVDNLSNDNCGMVNLVSAVPSSFNCSNIGVNNVTLTVNDGHGNQSTCIGHVTIADATPPTAICQNTSVNLNGSGSASITASQVNNGSTDNCGIVGLSVSPSSFNCSNIGNQTVTLTITDNAGLTATCDATVTVNDATPPTAICQDISVNLGANGTVSIIGAQVNNGSNDNCGIANLSVSPSNFNCSNIGNQLVTLTVADNSNLANTCMATVTVSDATAPAAGCQNISVNLDENGNASITGGQVDGGSSDNCGIASLSVSPNTFDINDVGQNSVTLTVTDNNSLTATCMATVTVTNSNAPNAVCQPHTAVLDVNGSVTITPANVDGGSTAVGGIASMSVLPNTLNCSNLGTNSVTLTVVGNNSQQATCQATVTVQDNTAPAVACQNISVNLSGSTASITPSQVFNAAGSSDNCGTVNPVNVSPNTFNCSNLGANSVTLTADDGNGNTATCNATVTINDNTPPTVVCQNIPVNLNMGGTASITASQVFNAGASSDNCGTVNLVGVSPNSFTCSNLGANTVALTANDGHGNQATCNATITVNDNLAPNALCRDIVVQLDQNGNVSITASQVNNGSTDNCGLGTLSVSPNTFTLADVGINSVTLTVPDVNGNSATCMAQVTVENNQLPNAICQNISRNLDINSEVNLAAADVDDGSSALGGIASMSVFPNLLTCSEIGANTVTLTVIGNNGQQASCNATVTVSDATAPTVACQNISIVWNGATNMIVAADVFNAGSSSDNCGTINLVSVSPNSFNCSNLGSNTVTLTANDGHGNEATCEATVMLTGSAPIWYADTDSDSYGDPMVSQMSCNQPSGYVSDNTDCNDNNMAIHPGAMEVCNNLDDDCDMDIDEGVGSPTIWYQDADNDGYGNPSVTQGSCTQPSGYVSDNTDCDDGDMLAHPGQTWYKDFDGDSYSDGTSQTACLRPLDYFAASELMATSGDCDDNNLLVHPNATEVCNGVDDDCDTEVDEGAANPATWYADSDGDNYGNPSVSQESCTQLPGYVADNTDCDDTNAAVNPATVWYKDADGDGYSDGTTQVQCTQPTGYALATNLTATSGDCDDNDPSVYSSATWYKDVDGDGYSDGTSLTQCSQPVNYYLATDLTANSGDCDDSDPTINPMTVWYKDSDGDGFSNGMTKVQCIQPANYYLATALAATSGDCDDTDPAINPTTVWYKDSDGDGYSDGAVSTQCVQPINFYLASNLTATSGDCDDADANEFPGQTWYIDTDNDGYGNSSVVQCERPMNGKILSELAVGSIGTDDCDDADMSIHPNAQEVCDNIDNNCNNLIDTNDPLLVDNEPPTVVCQNISITPDNQGNAVVSPSDVFQSGNDNCGTVNPISVSPNLFTCANEGPNQVTLTVGDSNGNTATCIATVTVEVFLTEPAINVVGETCIGAGDGSIQVSATAPAGQVGYSVDGGINFSFDGDFHNLAPGTYNIVVKVFGISNICQKTTIATVGAGVTPSVWYKDSDGDGYTDGNTLTSCVQPNGYIANPQPGTDCNDYDPTVNIVKLWYKDFDNDSYTNGTTQSSCTRPTGFKLTTELVNTSDMDCNDNNTAINVAAIEICNGIDDDCDGEIDEGTTGGLTYTGNVVFYTQAAVDGFSQCYSIINGNLMISGANINDLSNLTNLVKVTGNVNIQYTGLADMDGLDTLSEIGGTLTIYFNNLLETLSGFDSLETVGGSLMMYYNFKLSDCCAFYDLLNNNGVTGSKVIFFNKVGCNSIGEILSNCVPNNPLIGSPNTGNIISNTAAKQQLTIYPNPTERWVTVRTLPLNDNCSIKLFDLSGKLVRQWEMDSNQSQMDLDLSAIHKGLYILQMNTGDDSFIEKLIIQ